MVANNPTPIEMAQWVVNGMFSGTRKKKLVIKDQ